MDAASASHTAFTCDPVMYGTSGMIIPRRWARSLRGKGARIAFEYRRLEMRVHHPAARRHTLVEHSLHHPTVDRPSPAVEQ